MIESNYRRIPIYILADTSDSMAGAPIEALNNQLKELKDILMSDPFAYEAAYLSLITFGGEKARVVCPLTTIRDFQPPFLEASGLTPLGDAMKKLNKCIDNEVRLHDGNHRGDYKPLVYVLTDGCPNDDGWREAVEAVKNRTNQVAYTVTLGFGPEIDEENIKFISSGENDFAIKVEGMTPEIILTFFMVMSGVPNVLLVRNAIEKIIEDDPDCLIKGFTEDVPGFAEEGVFGKKTFKEEFGEDVIFIE